MTDPKRVAFLVDRPMVLAYECQDCDGTGHVTKEVDVASKVNHREVFRAAWLCATCHGRGSTLTEDGERLLDLLDCYYVRKGED